MTILVNTHSELEEKVLIAFLESLKYEYRSGDGIDEAFLDQYNKDIDEAEAEIDSGNYVDHDYVEKLFAERRTSFNVGKWLL